MDSFPIQDTRSSFHYNFNLCLQSMSLLFTIMLESPSTTNTRTKKNNDEENYQNVHAIESPPPPSCKQHGSRHSNCTPLQEIQDMKRIKHDEEDLPGESFMTIIIIIAHLLSMEPCKSLMPIGKHFQNDVIFTGRKCHYPPDWGAHDNKLLCGWLEQWRSSFWKTIVFLLVLLFVILFLLLCCCFRVSNDLNFFVLTTQKNSALFWDCSMTHFVIHNNFL